jgi:hypothetical protein
MYRARRPPFSLRPRQARSNMKKEELSACALLGGVIRLVDRGGVELKRAECELAAVSITLN